MSVNINADTTNGLVMTSDTSGEIKLQSAGADKVTIDTSGNVGIGTSSPNTLFHAQGSNSGGNVTVATLRNNNAVGSTQTSLRFTNSTADGTSGGGELSYLRNSADQGASFIVKTQSSVGVNTERMRINSLGRVGIGTTDPSQSLDVNGAIQVSGGIYLGGTTAANLLDDYEEGTWTPAIDAVTSPNSVTYNTQSGYYVKIGDLVHVWGNIAISTISGGSSQIIITGLPFTVADVISSTGVDGTGYCPFWAGLNTSIYWLGCWALGGSNHLRMTKTASAVTQTTDFTPADLTTGSQFRFAAWYKAS